MNEDTNQHREKASLSQEEDTTSHYHSFSTRTMRRSCSWRSKCEGTSDIFVEDASGELEAPSSIARLVVHYPQSGVSVGRRPSLQSESSSKSRIAFSLLTGGPTTTDEEPRMMMPSFLASCLTANFISVGYLFVPWGELLVHSVAGCIIS
jgi:hypothetical protein